MKTLNLKILVVLVFNLFNWNIYCQTNIRGTVYNQDHKTPVPSASVYINGTTMHTLTDSEGHFVLEHTKPPFQLVVSSLGYMPFNLTIDSPPDRTLIVNLKEKEILLMDAIIESKVKSLRNKYIEEFKNEFLGSDDWGKKAILVNDSDLVLNIFSDTVRVDSNFQYVNTPEKGSFKHQYDLWQEERSMEKIFSVLSVTAKAPIIVEVPLLGYTIHVQLYRFELRKREDLESQTSYVGTYFFIPYPINKEKGVDYFEKNREKAYYNSSMHFFRSLYSNALKQNGYVTGRFDFDDSLGKSIQRFNDLFSFCQKSNSDQLQVKGAENKSFSVYYFKDAYGKPLDLVKIDSLSPKSFTERNLWFKYISVASKVSTSRVTFLNDCCTTHADGTIPEDGNIKTGGEFALRGVGSKLPSDFLPR